MKDASVFLIATIYSNEFLSFVQSKVIEKKVMKLGLR